ncbi:MAG: glycosyltransferase, partial [Anaerolineaceae bacterium]|nr:glycosyltransferase [Anaerolineaceae bacterium]
MIGYLALLVLAALVLLVWISRHITISGISRSQDTLRPEDRFPLPEEPPKVSIIVPAKDEQDNIAECIGTLLAQDYPDFEIIVVDDRSTDRTAAIAGELAEREERIRLVQVDE